MDIPTIILEGPRSKAKIEIKEWITGADREYVNAPLQNVEINTQIMGNKANMQMGKLDPNAMMTESTHREFEKFVVSINGSKENIVSAFLDLPEEDVAYVTTQIEERGPKKKGQGSKE